MPPSLVKSTPQSTSQPNTMNLNQTSATPEQLAALMTYPADTPVVMVNILKYKARTGQGDETGAEAYARYMRNVAPVLAQAGGKLLWKGTVHTTVIGETEGQPDVVLLVEYPSVQHFLKMASSPAYQAVADDRTLALEYGGLLATMPERTNLG